MSAIIYEFPTANRGSDNETINRITNSLLPTSGLIAFNSVLCGLTRLLDSSFRQKPAADHGSVFAITSELCKELYKASAALPEYKKMAVEMIIKLIGDIIE